MGTAGHILAAALTLTLFWACRAHSDRPGDILLISVDTLRADHLDLYGYARQTTPELRRWFAEGRIFERSYATSSYTTASMVSVLSGQLPQEHGLRLFDQLLPEDAVLITELLPGEYQKAAFIANGVLSDRAMAIAHRFDHFDDRMELRHDSFGLERSAENLTDAAIAWLEDQRDSARPLFLWVHYMDPHTPYDPPQEWRKLFDLRREGDAAPKATVRFQARQKEKAPLDQIDAYDAEIAYTDSQIGRLLEAYGRGANLDDALLVFTADHGESLAERGIWFQHGLHVFDEQVRVPLLIRGPGFSAGRDGRLTSAIDLLPTFLAFAGVDSPEALAGGDLARPAAYDGKRTIFVESMSGADGTQWRAAIREDGKWFARVNRDGTITRRFSDPSTDPDETKLGPWPKDSSGGEELMALIERDPDPAGRPSDYRQGALLQHQIELLRDLGYIVDDVPGEGSKTGEKGRSKLTEQQLERLRPLGLWK